MSQTFRTGLIVLACATLVAACGDDEAGDVRDAGTDATPDAGMDAGADAGDASADTDLERPVVYTEDRAPCADQNPLRNVYWGDLHVHTGYSFDAWVFDVHTTPEDAYRFGRGEQLLLPPLDAEGNGTQPVQLLRPLDFVAVTDHSEYLAEIQACTNEGNPAYDSSTCRGYRAADNNAILRFGSNLTNTIPERFTDVCSDDGIDCRGPLLTDVWQRIQDAAEAQYDRTDACTFTTFVGYEYTGMNELSNRNRNVIFRNDHVPALPVSYFEEGDAYRIWERLRDECLEAGTGCDALAIPHNSNWSNGQLYAPVYPGTDSRAEEAELAALRARIEPLMEIMQHKGDSECHNGLASSPTDDPFCAFEKLRNAAIAGDCGDGPGTGAIAGVGCMSRWDFLRGALTLGLAEWQRLGVNPYETGVIASTDTHNATPGYVNDAEYLGNWGNSEDEAAERLGTGTLTPGGVLFNPGGIAGVWSVENSRDALFEAMRRRETFGTSGPRIAVRMFGGWGYDDALCDDPAWLQQGYEEGVPMGGVLPAGTSDAPRFAVYAAADPGVDTQPGTPLQRIQIIKGWIDADGTEHEVVYDVAGDPDNGASVDPDTCETSGDGFDTLCTVWTDPDFDPAVPAWYYTRVLENPTCRWSGWECSRLDPDARPASCTDPARVHTQQERAWTSPIWYYPER